MNTPSSFCAALFLSTLLSAQAQPAAAPQPPQGQGTATKPANPEAAIKPVTPEERIAQLKKELEKLQGEKAFIDQVEAKGGLPARVRAQVTDRKVTHQTTEDSGFKASSQPAAGNPAGNVVGNDGTTPNPVAAAPRKKARLLGDAEKKNLSAEVVMTVDGLPITKQEVEDVMSYFKSYVGEASDDTMKTRAMTQLITARAVEAAFPKTAAMAEKSIEDAKKALESGKSFEDVAKAMSQCPSKERGGDLGSFPREGMMDLLFAKAAFSQKVGEVSKVVRTPFGFHIVKTTAFKKGATPAQDEVQASHILAMYDADQMKVRQAAGRAYSGQVDIAFASDEWRKLCPLEFQ